MNEMVVVDGVERPITNNLGWKIHPTNEGVENFWRWFKNAPAVDGQGRPLVMFHGTASVEINSFSGFRKVAGHFAFDVEVANDWAGSRHADAQDNGTDDEYGDGAVVYAVYLAVEKLFDARLKEHRQLIGFPDDQGIDYEMLEEALEKIKAAGFDSYFDFELGHMSDDGQPTGIAVFSAGQVKSSLGNSGRFDPGNPRFTDDKQPS